MKKTAVFLLCCTSFACTVMLSAIAAPVCADDLPNTDPGKVVLGTVVPDSHKITLTVKGNANVTVNGVTGSEFDVERLSEPVIEIKAKEGERIVRVTLNGEDITAQIVDGKYTLPPVYENTVYEFSAESEKLPDDPSVPDSTASDPDSTESDPDSTESDPDSTESNPNSTESDPDSTESDPDSTESDPDSTESGSDSTSSKSGSSTTSGGGTTSGGSTTSGGGTASGGGTSNPATGVIGTISAGSLLAVGALTVVKRKKKDE